MAAKFHQIISEIDKLKVELDSLRPFDATLQKKVEQTFRLWWNYHSNAIEGNQLTLGETKSLIMHGLTAKGKPIKDHNDIEGHNRVLLILEDIVKVGERDISENFIRELHEALLVKSYQIDSLTLDDRIVKKWVKLGEYKSHPNNVLTSTGETHYYARPEETASKMTDLIDWYRKESSDGLNPIILAADFHYRFVAIHPFDDGNGRMSRILMNLILMKHGYVPALLKIEQRPGYITALENADAGDKEEFFEYIAKCELDSIDKYLKGVLGEDIAEPDDYKKELQLIEQEIDSISKTERKIKRSQQVIKAFYDRNFLPLFALTDALLKKIDKNFEDRYLDLTIFLKDSNLDNSVIDVRNWASLDSVLNSSLWEHFVISQRVSFNSKFSRLSKIPEDNQEISCKVQIEFGDYEIRLFSSYDEKNNLEGLVKLYSQNWSTEELTKFTDNVMKHLVDELKVVLQKYK